MKNKTVQREKRNEQDYDPVNINVRFEIIVCIRPLFLVESNDKTGPLINHEINRYYYYHCYY